MPNPRWGDHLLKHLVYDEAQRAYFVPDLGPGVSAHYNGRFWYVTHNLGSAAWLGVEGTKFSLDNALGVLCREPVPHTRLARPSTGHHYAYRYEPWEMNIYVDEHKPRSGSTFKATLYRAYPLKLNRLKNFRAFLTLLQHAKETP